MSSPVTRRPHATVYAAIHIAEAMDIDATPWEGFEPTTYESFRVWQRGLFASYKKRRESSLDANSTVLTAVPTAASAVGSDEAVNECGVCIETLVGGTDERTAIRLNACCHAVHKECMVAWQEVGGRTCPFCRTPLATSEVELNEYWLEDLVDTLPHLQECREQEQTEGVPRTSWWW